MNILALFDSKCSCENSSALLLELKFLSSELCLGLAIWCIGTVEISFVQKLINMFLCKS